MDDKAVKDLQAKAVQDLQNMLASADSKPDSVQAERFLFIMKLIEARIVGKMTQAELAKKVGTKQSVISRIESGKGNPSLNTLLKIAKALEVSLVLK